MEKKYRRYQIFSDAFSGRVSMIQIHMPGVETKIGSYTNDQYVDVWFLSSIVWFKGLVLIDYRFYNNKKLNRLKFSLSNISEPLALKQGRR